MIYITGDTHGRYDRIITFCKIMQTTKDDILIILGDAGWNYYQDSRDTWAKKQLESLPITLFCGHGNHEQRPASIPTYSEQEWHGGTVYVEEQFPSILFAKDGEVYDLNGMQAIAIGGAFSIDWMYRIPGRSWWPDEQPSKEVKANVERKLGALGWKVDVVLSHTVPLKYEPVEVFLPGIDQSKVDKTTEEWLDSIEGRLHYDKWYAGHYHTNKAVDKIQLLFEDYDVLCL